MSNLDCCDQTLTLEIDCLEEACSKVFPSEEEMFELYSVPEKTKFLTLSHSEKVFQSGVVALEDCSVSYREPFA